MKMHAPHRVPLCTIIKEKMLLALMNAVGKNGDDEEESKFRVRIDWFEG